MDSSVLTAPSFLIIFQQTFPGAQIQETTTLTGVALSAPVWDYSIEASLTTRPLAESDTPGEVIVTFKFNPPKRRMVVLAQATLDNMADYRTALEELKARLMGVVATIIGVCELPPPPARKSIFD